MCVCIIINIKIYHKTLPQFRINYSWFYTFFLQKIVHSELLIQSEMS